MSAAPADSSVTLYGIVDVAIEALNNAGLTQTTLTRMPQLTGTAHRDWA